MHTRPERRASRGLGAAGAVGGLVLGLAVAGCQVADNSDQPTAAARPQRASESPQPRAAPQPRVVPLPRADVEGPSRRGGVARADPAARPGRPQSLVVPRLGVDAPVVPIVATERVLLPPSDPQVIGWWADGARPGAVKGSAVLTGHTVHTGGGAFDDLGELRVSDVVTILTREGRLEYVVRSVTDYPKQSLATHAERVFGQEVPGRLVLVTCEDWNGVTYLSNTVVIAEPAW